MSTPENSPSRLRTPELKNYITRRRLGPSKDAVQGWLKDKRGAGGFAPPFSEPAAVRSAPSQEIEQKPSTHPLSNGSSMRSVYESQVAPIDLQPSTHPFSNGSSMRSVSESQVAPAAQGAGETSPDLVTSTHIYERGGHNPLSHPVISSSLGKSPAAGRRGREEARVPIPMIEGSMSPWDAVRQCTRKPDIVSYLSF